MVGLLERFLRPGKIRPDGVVDEIQFQIRFRLTISQLIQPAQGFDALREDAFSALLLHVFFGITGERRGDLHLVVAQKLRKVLFAFDEEHRQVAAVDDVSPQRARLGDEVMSTLGMS